LTEGTVDGSLALRDGDKIVVSVLGASLAVSGDVKRSGIFETPADGAAFSFGELMNMAGGVLRPGANRFVKFSLTAWGEEKVQDIFPGDAVSFGDGDILMVTGGEPLRVNGVQLLGHVRVPGSRALNKAPNIRALLSGTDPFKQGVYPMMGVIVRTDAKNLATKLIAFSPILARQGKENIPLTERDRVMVFSAADIADMMKQKSENIFNADEENTEEEIEPSAGSENPLLTEEVTDFLCDHAATVTGAVRHEGRYPVAGKISLNEFLAGAGGLNTTADGTTIELMLANRERDGKRYTIDLSKDRPDDILISSRDKVVVTAAPTMAEDEGVLLTGEVARPGHYDLRKGDTLLDLYDRAGGLTDTGFAKGTIFLRASERRKQEEKFRAVARELDLAVANIALKKDPGKHDEQIKVAQDIARELRIAKGVGRISVEADPVVLRTQPEMAILLQPGDRIHVPRRSMTVAVAGEILSPAVLQYRAGQRGTEYIKQAGGITRYADDDRAFVVFPDGSAAPLNANRRWNGNDIIPAGSTVVVPRDPNPLEFLEVTSAIGGILSQLVVGSVAIAEIRD
jgi:polysaccharide export outer membrane protein